jgi:hypothetical protein
MAPVKIGARESTETRMTERKICVFIDIFGTAYWCSDFNTCGNNQAQTSGARTRYQKTYRAFWNRKGILIELGIWPKLVNKD